MRTVSLQHLFGGEVDTYGTTFFDNSVPYIYIRLLREMDHSYIWMDMGFERAMTRPKVLVSSATQPQQINKKHTSAQTENRKHREIDYTRHRSVESRGVGGVSCRRDESLDYLNVVVHFCTRYDLFVVYVGRRDGRVT